MAAFPFFSTCNPVRAKSEARQPSSQSPAAIAANRLQRHALRIRRAAATRP